MKKVLAILGCIAVLATLVPFPAEAFAAPPAPQVIPSTPHEKRPLSEKLHEKEHNRNENEPEHEHGHELGPINWFDFSNKEQPPWGAYAINFAILIAIYVYYGKDAITKGLVDRRAKIKGEIDEAQKLLKEAEKRATRYQKKLEELDADMEGARKALIDAGYSERERIIREAREKAARMERDAQFLVQQELKQSRDDLVRDTLDRAINTAEELIKKSLTPADHERLADEYLKQLQAMSASDLSQKRSLS